MSLKQRARRLTAAYWIPIVITFIFAPGIVTSYRDKTDSFRGLIVAELLQMMMPGGALWWPVLFSYEAMVSKGNELLYVKNRNKLKYYIMSLVIYCACAIPSYVIMNSELSDVLNVTCEYVRFVIGSMFLVSAFYMLNYVFGNFLISTIICAAYSITGFFFYSNKSIKLLFYDDVADWKLIRDQYLLYLVAAVVMFAIGYVFNRNREKYLK